MPLSEVDRVAKLIPGGPKITIDSSLEAVPDLQTLYRDQSSASFKKLIDTAKALEGVASHASTHAAGVVIADRPLVEYVPLHRPTKGEGGAVTQYPMEALDKIGLLKVDFLGLSTLTIMRRACDLIFQNHGVELDLHNIPLDDPASFDLMSSGDVTGLFQVESEGMRKALRGLLPKHYEDVMAVIALYRPGPMQFIEEFTERRHGRRAIEYVHPRLEPILKKTYGIIVYQEQIIRILTDLAGYTASAADNVRKAVGKKKKEVLLAEREKFVRGAIETSGLGQEQAEQIFDQIEKFASYGFNQAHAADYAVITCQTAYLKSRYPLEYMTALLCVERSNTEKIGIIAAESRRLGIEILRPDINHSVSDFVIEDGKIRFGLGAIKGVGDGPIAAIVNARQEGGNFATLDDFCNRVDLRLVNRKVLECLIKVGCLDALGERNHLLDAIDTMMAVSLREWSARSVGQMSMFALGGDNGLHSMAILDAVGAPAPAVNKQRFTWERELAGTFFTEHPLQAAVAQIKSIDITASNLITEELVGQYATLVGSVTSLRTILTRRKNEEMAFIQMEDLQGSIELVVFPKTYRTTKPLWAIDRIVLVRGRIDFRDQKPKIICDWATDQLTIPRMAEPERPSGQLNSYDYVPDPEAPLWGDSVIDEGAGEFVSPALTVNGGAPEPHAEPSPEPVTAPMRDIIVSLQRAGDLDAEKRHLKRLYQLFLKYPGRDHFRIRLTQGLNCYELEFPNATTQYCDALAQELQSALPPGALRVDAV
jgi:DNA polymerase-3 subunit alpha